MPTPRLRPPGLSTDDHAPPDSHPRHRSRAPPHRLGRGGDRGQPAELSSPAARSRPTTRRRWPMRLLAIHDGLRRVVARACARTRPRSRRPSSTRTPPRRSSSARRAASRMLVPAIAGLPVAEYAPNLVKKTIVGAGHGEKAQIRMMIGVLLPKADPAIRRRRRRARDRGVPCASSPERGAQGGGALIASDGLEERPFRRGCCRRF